MAAEQTLLPFVRTPALAMRSPSPQLAGSKRDCNGAVLETSAWKRHMVENFGCEIETAGCHRPICVNPQHLLVNADTHDDLHRHKACLVAPPHQESPKPGRHLPPLTTVAADICAEGTCNYAAPHSSSDSRCEGMFWDPCSPSCSGDEACPVPDACADPNCDLQDVCWDNLCTGVDCDAPPCPDGLCLVDEVCYKEPCPRASSCEQGHACAASFGDHIDHDVCQPGYAPACHVASNQHLCQELENWIATNSGAPNASHHVSHCYGSHAHAADHCSLPQYHTNGYYVNTAPSCYSHMHSMNQHGSSGLDELSRLAQLNDTMFASALPHHTAGSCLSGCTRTAGNPSAGHGGMSESVVSSPDPHLPLRPHHRRTLNGFFHPPELGGMGLKGSDPLYEPPCKKAREASLARNAPLSLFGSGQLGLDMSTTEVGIAQSVEDSEHVCLWQTSVKSEDGKPALCGLKFASAKDLAEHLKDDHTEGMAGKYCCHWHGCTSNTDFKQSGKLARHFAIHSKYKRFQCRYCDKSFNTAQTLENHHNTHTGERPHACHYEGCNYAAATATQLKGHIQGTHLKEKRFQCKLCDFCCTDSSNLTKHENGVHGRKEYRCPHLGCTAAVTNEWSAIRKHFKESGHCPELLESNSQAQKRFKKAAVVKDQAGVMVNGRRAPISRNRTKRSETAEQNVKSESMESLVA